MALLGKHRINQSKEVSSYEQEQTIEEKIKEYIDGQRCVLWGRFFDINSKEGHRQAQEFILDILIDLGLTSERVE